ncbi:MAG: hypothetical protein ACI9LM_003033 [Alteromonadaceae bacterium]|jgi:hypothetical protein
MTFIYIVKTIASKWINALSNTPMIEDLIVHETQSIRMAKQLTADCANQLTADQPCNKI